MICVVWAEESHVILSESYRENEERTAFPRLLMEPVGTLIALVVEFSTPIQYN